MVASLQHQQVNKRGIIRSPKQTKILQFNTGTLASSNLKGIRTNQSNPRSLKARLSSQERLQSSVIAVDNDRINRILLAIITVLTLFLITGGLRLESGNSSPAFRLPNSEIALPTASESELYLKNYTFSPITEEIISDEPVVLPDRTLFSTLNLTSYTVQNGDAISIIARDFGVTMGTLISFNSIEDVNRLQVGTVLSIPNMNGVLHRVERGDSLSGIAVRYGADLNRILDANDLESAVIYPGQQLFIPQVSLDEFSLKRALGTLFLYPVSGRLTSAFGTRSDPFTGTNSFHNGVDLANSLGTPVKAAMSGSVVDCGVNSVYGNYIILNHRNGFQTLYGHLSAVQVSRGQTVSQEQQIGLMGSTGRSTGSHLHFSIFLNNLPVNPMGYLN